MNQLAFDFNPPRALRIDHRSYGGLTPSQWRDTSILAAVAAEKFAPKQRDRVLMALTREPGANHELALRLKMKLQTVCPRVAEIREDGLIEDSGQRRKTDAGCKAVIWQTTPLGGKIGWALIQAGMEKRKAS